MYIETIFRVWCPKCKAVNYLENGCTEDLTLGDVEGVECYKCKHRFLLDGDDDDKDGDELDGYLYTKGLARIE